MKKMLLIEFGNNIKSNQGRPCIFYSSTKFKRIVKVISTMRNEKFDTNF